MELKTILVEKVNTMRSYVAQNKGLAVLLSLLILLFSSGLIFMTLRGPANATPDPDPLPTATTNANEQANTPPETNSNREQVEVLPQLERMEREGTLQPLDPFAAPPVLVGVLLGGNGENIAIIEAGGNTYITRVGDMVSGLWNVREIHRDRAVIRLGENETVLHLGR